jgi:predicted molibdopterin-dependent oxidoreductase YjgC
MGAKGFDHEDAESVFHEMSAVQAAYGGMSHRRLQSGGLQWPCAAQDAEDTPILYTADGHNGKARLSPMALSPAPEHSDPDYPLLLAKGRLLHDADRTMEIVKNGTRTAIQRDEIVELHEDDGRELGIAEDEWVEVVSAAATLRGVVKLTSPHKGLVSTTGLFGQMATELDASDEPDPMLKVEGLPLVPVRVGRLTQEAAD